MRTLAIINAISVIALAQIIRGMWLSIPAAHATWVVETEVNNGGFNQFFWNSSAQYAPNAVAGFKLFELPTLARLMERAIDVNDKETTRLEKFKQRGSLEAFSESYKENSLNNLDKEFYEAAKSLSATRVAFIRERPELLVGQSRLGWLTIGLRRIFDPARYS